MSAAVSARPALEVADIIREHGDAWLALCRRLLLVEAVVLPAQGDNEVTLEPAAAHRCPNCGSARIACELILNDPRPSPCSTPLTDTS